MPVRKVAPGDTYQVSAESFNRFADAASFTENAKKSGAGGAFGFGPQPTVVRLKNTTEAAIPQWGILQATTPIVLPSDNEEQFLDQVMLNGIAPASDRPAFVAVEPVPAGELGRFIAPGVIVAVKLSLPDSSEYTLARPSDVAAFEAVDEADLADNDFVVRVLWHEAGPGEKWALVLMPGGFRRATSNAGGCDPCDEFAGELTVDTGGGVMGSTHYSFAPFCVGSVTLVFAWVSALTWEIPENSLVLVCVGDDVTFTASIVATGRLPGEVRITISDGTNSWVWENETVWQPGSPTWFVLVEGDQDCPCAPWETFACLKPAPAPPEEEP